MIQFSVNEPTSHKRTNRIQSVLMITTMAAILGLCGYVIDGVFGLAVAVFGVILMIMVTGRISPQIVLKMYKAVPLTTREAPGLVQLFNRLVDKAGFSVRPKLYYVPSKVMNAFAVGNGRDSVIAVTDALLRNLAPREVAGVLAHEMSHILHNDLFVMSLADAFSRVTALMGQIGQIMVLVSIPALFLGYQFPWLAALILMFAPAASAMLQLALSRSREYEADFGAAQITSDPMGLVSALSKIEMGHGNWFEKILMPGRKVPEPALLRSHPATQDRIARLKNLVSTNHTPQALHILSPLISDQPKVVVRAPKWHLNGLWY